VISSKKQAVIKKKYDEAKKQERSIKSEIDNIEKHAKLDNKEKKKQLRHLAQKKSNTGRAILEKIGDIRTKAFELSALIDKMK
jgi:hypothetical protein